MAQLVVRKLEDDVKARLQQREGRNGVRTLFATALCRPARRLRLLLRFSSVATCRGEVMLEGGD